MGLAFYTEGTLQRLDIQVRLGQELLQLRVLRLELAQPLGLIDLQSAELRALFVERRVTEAVRAAQLLDRHPGLGFLQKPDDLLLRKSPLLHARFSFQKRTLLTSGC